ncbi:hypothetical protein JZY91_08820 [Corynebacterium sp. CNCTC7651]|nr:hypothetical protein JZY91_08820 [Corynebacterium sp. CNCTC7651]
MSRSGRGTACGIPPPGLPAPGLPAPGLPAPGLPAPGLPAPGLPAPGLPALGLPALGLPALGLPALGSSFPRTKAMNRSSMCCDMALPSGCPWRRKCSTSARKRSGACTTMRRLPLRELENQIESFGGSAGFFGMMLFSWRAKSR